MGKIILFVSMLLTISFTGKASHFAGGNISVKYDTAFHNYRVTLTVYRAVEPSNIPFSYTSNVVNYSKAGGPYIPLSLKYDSTSVSLLNNDFDSSVLYIYSDTVSLQPDNYRFEFDLCCMNISVVNVSSSSGDGLVFYTDVTIDSLNNSAPDFFISPAIYFPVSETISYNSYPYDLDGDSTTYSFFPLQQMSGTIPPYFADLICTQLYAPAHPYGAISLNSFTGEITWTPNQIGKFAHGSIIKEYRNGSDSGRTIRDQEYIVLNISGDNPPYLQPITPYSGTDTKYLQYTPGQPLVFEIDGYDGDSTYPVSLKCKSTLFNASNPPVFSDTGTQYLRHGTFTWTPPIGYHKTEKVVFRVKDSLFTNDFTLMLTNYPIVGVENLQTEKKNSITLIPNPVNNILTIATPQTTQAVEVIDVFGRVVYQQSSFGSAQLPKSQKQIDCSSWPSGLYLVRCTLQDGSVVTGKVVKE